MKRLRQVLGLGVVLVIALGVFCATASAQAGWKKEGVEIIKGVLNIPYSWENRQTAIFDKTGAIFMYTANKRYYLQKIDTQAEKTWGNKGVLIRSAKDASSSTITILSDNFGGALVAYTAHSKMYIQKVNKHGKRQWGSKGILFNTAQKGSIPEPIMVSDGLGGAIISWHDDLDANGIHVVRVTYEGGILWGKSGNDLFNGRQQGDIKMVVDKNGFIYICNNGRHLQKIDRNGRILWSKAGVTVAPQYDWYQIVANGKSGVIIAGGNYTGKTSVATKIDAQGNLLWPKSGATVSNFSNDEYARIVSDGKGGMVAVWEDKRSDNKGDIYAQRLNSAGRRVWGRKDKKISDASYGEYDPVIINNKKSVVIGWYSGYGYHSQKINTNGKTQWSKAAELVNENYTNSLLFGKFKEKFIVLSNNNLKHYPSSKNYIFAYQIGQNGNFVGE